MFQLRLLLPIVLAILHYLIAYAFLVGQAEDILRGVSSRKFESIADKAGYKCVQAQFAIGIGTISPLVPVSIFDCDDQR